MGKKIELTYTKKDGSVIVLGTAEVSDDGNTYNFTINAGPVDPAKPDSGYLLPGMVTDGNQ